MDRRRFLGAGGVSALGLASSGAASPVLGLATSPPTGTPPDINEFVARLDRGMDQISKWSPTADFSNWGEPAAAVAMVRTGLQSMYMTGMISDIPVESQIHPEVQKRIRAAEPIMDEAVDRTMSFLKGCTAEDLDRVQSRLQNRAVGEYIVRELDEAAAATGITEWRREQTRAILEQIEFRLRSQPPSLIVDEYVEKVERLTESGVMDEARTRDLAARIGEEAFWQVQDKRTARIRRGAKVMGLGVATFAVGALIVAVGAVPGVFVMTAGAVMFLVGLIIVLVGAVTPRG